MNPINAFYQSLGLEMMPIADQFLLARTPVTNEQYGMHVDKFETMPYVLLRTDPATEETAVVDRLRDPDKEIKDDRYHHALSFTQKFAPVSFGNFTLLHLRRDISPKGFDAPGQPVVRMSWFHAFEYCVTNGLFLPSDDQWSRASGIYEGLRYATSTGKLRAEDGRKLAHFSEDATIDVNDPCYPDGPHGLRHMTGNVWEWTAMNPKIHSNYAYGKRGGSWQFDADDQALKSSYRNNFHPAYDPSVWDAGFRPAALSVTGPAR